MRGGGGYGYVRDPWSAPDSAVGFVPTPGYHERRGGVWLPATAAGEYHPSPAFAYRLGIDARFDGRTREAGEVEPDTGGAIAYLSPELVYSPATDVLVNAYLRVPVVDALIGRHDEGVIAGLGVARDF